MDWMRQSKDIEWVSEVNDKTHLYAAYKRLTSEVSIHTG